MNGEQEQMCSPFRHELGAYVVGGLEQREREALDDHLARCERCRAQLAEFAALPALLELARDPGPEVPDRVRDRVIAAAAHRRGRRRWAMASAAAALVAGLLGVVVGLQLTPREQATVAVPLEGVEPFEEAGGWMRLDAGDDGLLVTLDVHGLPSLPEPEVYEAWLYTHDERIVSIGQLDVLGDDGTVQLAAEGDADQYRGFWITAEPDRRDPAHDGPTVLRAPVPAGP